METTEETERPVVLIDFGRLLVALGAWTGVGLLLIGLVVGSEEALLALDLSPRVAAVLHVLTERVSLALALAGWGLGVVGICTVAGIRAVMRKPVVLPWTEGLFPHPR